MVARGHRIRNDYHPVRSAMDSVGGMADADRRDLYVYLSFPGELDRPLFPVARCRVLSAELRLADLDRSGRDNPRLDTDENAQFRRDVSRRWRGLGRFD